MALDSLVQPLRNLALFQGLSAAQMTAIARRAERVVFKPGDMLIATDMPADSAIIIVAGEARRIEGPDIAAAEALPVGTLLGEMGMLIETVHTSSVIAASSVRALRIQRSELHEQMMADAGLAEHFVRRISERLHDIAAEMRAIDQNLGEGIEATDQALFPAFGAWGRGAQPRFEEAAPLH